MHLKEYGGPAGSVIGEGAMDWQETFRLCETTQNTEWYVVEEGGGRQRLRHPAAQPRGSAPHGQVRAP